MTFNDQAEDLRIGVSNSRQEIAVFDKDLWYAYTAGGNVNISTNESKTAITENAGVTWTFLLDSANNEITMNGGVFLPISSDTLFFGNGKSIGRYVKGSPSSGRLISAYTTFGGTGVLKILQNGNQLLGVGKHFAHLSLDRGQTWQIITSGGITSQEVIDIEFAGLDEIYILTEDNIFKSTDTAKTWLSVKQTMNLSPGATRGNRGISLLKSNEVILFGNDARLYKTTDGGQSWVDLRPNLPANLNFYDFRWMCFRTENNGYAGNPNPSGSSYVLETFDGGDTWNTASPGPNMIGLLDMDFSDSTTGAAIGIFGPNVNRYNGPTSYAIDTMQAVLADFSLTQNNLLEQGFYPNPSNGTIYFSGAANKKVSLFSLTGQLINEWIKPETKLHLGQLKSGVYFIQLENYQGSVNLMKLVIQ
jgi:hypothetical protein